MKAIGECMGQAQHGSTGTCMRGMHGIQSKMHAMWVSAYDMYIIFLINHIHDLWGAIRIL